MTANENTIPSTHPRKEHWAAQYRNAPRTSVEGWIYLAACTVKGDETAIREIGRIAYTSGCCTWHASWVYYGRTGLCHCADCARKRKSDLTFAVHMVLLSKFNPQHQQQETR